MPPMLRALSHRNYRLYFSGQLVSLAGTWMQQIAMSWLAYRLSGSAFVLGAVAFSGQIPILLLGSFGGLWSDRLDRRKLLMATQTLAMLQALLLAGITLTGVVQPWHLGLVALMLGTINAVDVPARQSFVVQLVDKRDDLQNAIALNSFTMNAARLVGPSIAGIAVALVGEGVCFLLNALSYLAVLAALAAMRTRHEPPKAQATAHALREGFAYAFGTPDIRRRLLLVACLSFFGTSYSTLMPLIASQVFGGDAHTYGLLMACAGAGALAGTLFLVSRRDSAQLPAHVARAAPLASVALMCFAESRQLWQAAPALVAIGFGMIICIAASNTLIQTTVKNELRGRVMALFSMAFLGIAPLGSLAAGACAEFFGPQPTLLAGGLLSLAGGLLLTRGDGRRARPA